MSRAALASLKLTVRVLRLNLSAMVPAKGEKRMTGIDYNANRPHSAHGELTPTEFALQWTTTHQPLAA